jgi:hypothetical protein
MPISTWKRWLNTLVNRNVKITNTYPLGQLS